MNAIWERRRWWPPILLALAYGAIMVFLNGRLYSDSPYHRYQAEALLHGRLDLGNSLDQLKSGLAWHDGHVQQVWGLGIGVWLLPFTALWHLFGGQIFPDRIALGIAFTLLAYYAFGTGIRLSRTGQRATGLGFIWLIILSPPLWTLTRASQLVFEETVLYALLLSLGILVALVRFLRFDSRRDYWLCCALAAFTGFVRPTHAVYGLGAVVACSLVLIIRQRAIKSVILGCLAFASGLGLLALTNWTRFGSPLEFGHRLTTSSDSMVYLTRLGNPYSATGTVAAGKELLSLLFLDPNVRDAGAFSEGLFSGQAPVTRWRRLYLTLFDPGWAVLCVSAGIGAILWLLRRRKEGFLRSPENAMVAGLLLWSSLSTLALCWFYLRFPIIASRYLLDFAPAITGLAAIGWFLISRRIPRLSLVLLAGWLLYELVSAKIPVEPRRESPRLQVLPHTPGVPLQQFGGSYDLSHHPATTVMAHNGYGWEPETGFAENIVILAVDRPQFLELRLSKRRGVNGEEARADVYQAIMDGVTLPLQQMTTSGNEIKVIFDIPAELRTRDELVFLCFSEGYDTEDRQSERFLYSIRWR